MIQHSEHMPLFFRYFWFIGAGFMLANIIIWRQKSGRVVSSGILSQKEFNHFIGWATVWLVGLPFVLGAIGLAAKWPSPFCAGMLSFTNLPRALCSLTVLFAWISLLWWIWRGNGADFIARVLPSLNPRGQTAPTFSPSVVRLAITGLVIFSAVLTPILWRTMPLPPEAVCPASTAEG